MNFEQLIDHLKQKQFHPVYWIEGKEPYFVDETAQYIEHHLLSSTDKQFDFAVFYGKDATYEKIFNACRKAPILSSWNVVLLKEAQHFDDLKRFENYIAKPLPQTVFFIINKDKPLDTKTKFGTLIKNKTEYINFAPLQNQHLDMWLMQFVEKAGYKITTKGLFVLVQYLGNDLAQITQELHKLFLNQPKEKPISDQDIIAYISYNKEFNIFDLQNALGQKDMKKVMHIVDYIIQNSKNFHILQVIILLYRYYVKLFIVLENTQKNDRDLAPLLGVPFFAVKEFRDASKKYNIAELYKNILVLSEYNLRSIGVGNVNFNDASLKKEMFMKLLNP